MHGWIAAFLLVCAISTVQAAPSQWKIDVAHSTLSWSVLVNGNTVHGKFEGIGAQIAFSPDDLAHSSVRVVLDTSGIKSGDRTRDVMLMQPEWFNVLDFPKAQFTSTSFTAMGGNKYQAKGGLWIKGIKSSIVLPFSLDIRGDKAVVKGETKLRRLDHKIGTGKDYQNGDTVGLEVKVMVNLSALRVK